MYPYQKRLCMVQKYHSYMRILIKASNIDIKCIYINDTRGCHSILLKRKEHATLLFCL